MHEPVAASARFPPEDADPERLEPARLAETNDGVIGGATVQCPPVHLGIVQPLCSRALISTQQTQVPRIDMKAPAVVPIGGDQAEAGNMIPAEGEKHIGQLGEVCEQVTEIVGFQALPAQQAANILLESRRRRSVPFVRQLRGRQGRQFPADRRECGTLPETQVDPGVKNLPQDIALVTQAMG